MLGAVGGRAWGGLAEASSSVAASEGPGLFDPRGSS